QTFGAVHFDQAPAAKRRRRRQRAPVGLGKRGHGQAEGGEILARIALRRGDRARESRIQLHPGAQEHDRSLEARETEGAAQPLERRRRRHFTFTARLPGPGAICAAAFERAAQRAQLAQEIILVGLVPGKRAVAHGKVTVGPKLTLAGSRSTGLSAPSICTRRKYCPPGTPGIAIVKVLPSAARGGARKLCAAAPAAALSSSTAR